MARLLITDDDPAILGLIRAILEPEGNQRASKSQKRIMVSKLSKLLNTAISTCSSLIS